MSALFRQRLQTTGPCDRSPTSRPVCRNTRTLARPILLKYITAPIVGGQGKRLAQDDAQTEFVGGVDQSCKFKQGYLRRSNPAPGPVIDATITGHDSGTVQLCFRALWNFKDVPRIMKLCAAGKVRAIKELFGKVNN